MRIANPSSCPAYQRRSSMTADWSRKFDEPIALPKGRQLATLKDAGTYITKLPRAEHEAAEWQAAMEALILVATSGGPTMFARIGVMRALNRHAERVFNPDRKEQIAVGLFLLLLPRRRGPGD